MTHPTVLCLGQLYGHHRHAGLQLFPVEPGPWAGATTQQHAGHDTQDQTRGLRY